ncbi:O-antigen polysaccharide polymerase Wzy [Dialister succinatiphilus]
MLDFGTEFSFIAETYMNFSWLGCVVSFIILLFFAQYIWAVYRFK